MYYDFDINDMADTPTEDLNDLVKKIQAEIDARAPKRGSLFLHSNKEELYTLGEELGIRSEDLRNFAYTASEIEIEFEVSGWGDNLEVHAISINGVDIPKVSI